MSVAEAAFLVLQPSALIAVVLAAGLIGLLMATPGARAVLGVGVGLFLVCGLLPVGSALLALLEAPFPFEGYAGPPPDGIIVLGGYLNPSATLATRQIALNDRAERITAAAALAKRYPDASVIVTDGGGIPGKSGADLSRVLLMDFGVAEDRIVLETEAASTRQNATLTQAIVDPAPDERFMLVTSAFHMPRAVATFRGAGWQNLIPWPVDSAADARPLWRRFPSAPAEGLQLIDLAIRELAATAYYRFAGFTETVFPAAAQSLTGPRTAERSTG